MRAASPAGLGAAVWADMLGWCALVALAAVPACTRQPSAHTAAARTSGSLAASSRASVSGAPWLKATDVACPQDFPGQVSAAVRFVASKVLSIKAPSSWEAVTALCIVTCSAALYHISRGSGTGPSLRTISGANISSGGERKLMGGQQWSPTATGVESTHHYHLALLWGCEEDNELCREVSKPCKFVNPARMANNPMLVRWLGYRPCNIQRIFSCAAQRPPCANLQQR